MLAAHVVPIVVADRPVKYPTNHAAIADGNPDWIHGGMAVRKPVAIGRNILWPAMRTCAVGETDPPAQDRLCGRCAR